MIGGRGIKGFGVQTRSRIALRQFIGSFNINALRGVWPELQQSGKTGRVVARGRIQVIRLIVGALAVPFYKESR